MDLLRSKRGLSKSLRARQVRRGGAAVELALCLPVLALLTFVTVEACNAVYLRQSLTIAAYEGARTAILPKSTAGNASQQAKQILNDRGVKGFTIKVSPTNLQKVAVGDFIKVSVEATMSSNSTFLQPIFGGRKYNAEVEMMKEYAN